MKSFATAFIALFVCFAATSQTVDKDNTLSADRPILTCPVDQPTVKNGAKPDIELFKKLIQCSWGEAPATKGYDGAITVDVTSLQVGTPRKWDILRDLGNGTVYPVKAKFGYKTFYRTRTSVSANWIRVFNFYVNAFGEWAVGSQESIKAGDLSDIPRHQ